MREKNEICCRPTLRQVFNVVLGVISVVNLTIVGVVYAESLPSTSPTMVPLQDFHQATASLVVPTSTDEVINTPVSRNTNASTNTATQTPSSIATNTLAVASTFTATPSMVLCVPNYFWSAYIVLPGDTLYSLANATGSTIQELMTANCLTSNLIRVGQLLYVHHLPSNTPTPTVSITPTHTPSMTPSITLTFTPYTEPIITSITPNPLPKRPQSSCLEFKDLTLGTTYKVGESFVSSGVNISVESFVSEGRVLINTGTAAISSQGIASGYNNEIQVNTVNLNFNFNKSLNSLSLLFGEYGGNLNMKVNGDFVNFANFADINGSVIGGVGVSVLNGYGNDHGFIDLSGKIQSFSVGGQELWIDNVCMQVNGG